MIRPALLILTLAPASAAGAFDLGFPVDCQLGQDCFIQNYFDHDPGPAALDFTCGQLTYDGHDGTDIRLSTLSAMEAGVTVHPVSAGRVMGVRDGMPDISKDDPAAPPLNGRDCGNGVLIDHGGGWQTQYCHMKLRSIAVKPGDQVGPATVLGKVGLSGNTVFPHLHLSVRKDGVEVDPFTPDAPTTCGAAPDPATDLWQSDIGYDGFGFLDAGISDAPPDYDAIRAGLPPRRTLSPDAPAMLVWGFFFGARTGDHLLLRLTGPEGVIAEQDVILDRNQAQAMQFTGRKARGAWPRGEYAGTLALSRDGKELERRDVRITVE